MPATQGLYARRMTTYDKFTFAPPDDLSVYDFEGREKVEVDAQAKPEEFWVDNRHVPVKKKKNAVDKLLARLRLYGESFGNTNQRLYRNRER